MKTSLLLVLTVSLAGDLIVFLASIAFLANKHTVNILTKYATPFAAGSLLSAAFLDFLHEGVEHYDPFTVLLAALCGIIFFFVLENLLHWFHHHGHEPFENPNIHKKNNNPITVLAISGNLLHNFIDGSAIAAAFLLSNSAGFITTLAVAMHEIPREIADSGYLLGLGMKRAMVIAMHGAAVIVTALGTIIFYLSAQDNPKLLAWLLGSTAGFFIYIASSDIIPSINQSRSKNTILDWQVILVILGAVIVGVAVILAHQFIEV